MDSKREDESGERSGQSTPPPTTETPQSKLRDLRPEKDPMGAGRGRKTAADPSRPDKPGAR